MSDLLSWYCSLSLSLSLIFPDGLKLGYSSHILNDFLGVKAFSKQWSENPINHVRGNQNSSQGKWNIITYFHQASCCSAPEFINQPAYLIRAWKKLLPDVKGEKAETCPAGPQLSKTLPCPCSAFHNRFNTCYPKGQCEMQIACAAGQVFLATNTSFLASQGRGSAVPFTKLHLPGTGKAEGQWHLWHHRALWKLYSPAFSIILICCCLEIKKKHKAKDSGWKPGHLGQYFTSGTWLAVFFFFSFLKELDLHPDKYSYFLHY